MISFPDFTGSAPNEVAEAMLNCAGNRTRYIVIADAEMIALSLNVGICDLIVEKLSALGTAVPRQNFVHSRNE